MLNRVEFSKLQFLYVESGRCGEKSSTPGEIKIIIMKISIFIYNFIKRGEANRLITVNKKLLYLRKKWWLIINSFVDCKVSAKNNKITRNLNSKVSI